MHAQSCLTLCHTWTVAHRLFYPQDFPSKNTGVGCHFLLQGIFLVQESKPHYLHLLQCRWIFYHQATRKAHSLPLVKSLSHIRLFATPWTVASYQAPSSMEFSRQEYWSGLPFPSPGDLPDPGIKPGSPALQADALPSEPPGKLAK